MPRIGEISVGGKNTLVKVMGIINVSPESFYKGSIRLGDNEVAETAKEMQQNGADIIDIGGMSTAPYLETVISAEEEARRIRNAIRIIKDVCDLPVSADTTRATVAKEAIAAGAEVINDITGLKYDENMAEIVAKARLPVIIGAYSTITSKGRVIDAVNTLRESISLAKKAGIADRDIIVDPSIGFFRAEGKNPFFTKTSVTPWYIYDLKAISKLDKLKALKKPICISVSRKSFIGHLLNLEVEERLVPSIVCEMVAAINGVSIIRTHNVKETVQALAILQLLML